MRRNGHECRVRRFRGFAAFEFFGIRSAHEDCRHVWVWRARMRSQLRMVSTVCYTGCSTIVSYSRNESLSELVMDGLNGVIFQSGPGLADHLEVCSFSAMFPHVRI